jgi:hypothetical protein
MQEWMLRISLHCILTSHTVPSRVVASVSKYSACVDCSCCRGVEPLNIRCHRESHSSAGFIPKASCHGFEVRLSATSKKVSPASGTSVLASGKKNKEEEKQKSAKALSRTRVRRKLWTCSRLGKAADKADERGSRREARECAAEVESSVKVGHRKHLAIRARVRAEGD